VRATEGAGRFVVIGENVHATRVVLRKGSHVLSSPDGRDAIRFSDTDGGERLFRLPDAILASDEFRLGKVKHVKAALIASMSVGPEPDATDARDYLAWLVRRQIAAGAGFLDLNVDEISPDEGTQQDAMRWLVRLVEEVSPDVPVALDSSSAGVIRAGLEVSARPAGAPLLNSASVERVDVLDLAAEHGSPVVVTAAGRGAMPADAPERVANASAMVEAATARGIGLERLYVDPLVLPVAVDPEHGRSYLDAVGTLRAAFGPEVYLTGGLSNVSFGLPMRRLLNDVFIDLAVTAGADSGIIDPVANDLGRVLSQDRQSSPYRLAADLLLGRDPYGGTFLAAYRRGDLASVAS
jgi:5-methyltetrahydrofolate--homocysteine methyltransferase